MTLLEVMLTVGIVGIAIMGVLQVFLNASWLTETSTSLFSGMTEAHAIMEEIRSTEFDQITAKYGTSAGPPMLYKSSSMGNNGMGIIFVDDTNPQLLEVEVQVHWALGRQAIGEDQNINGVLDPGEDVNNNGRMDSPASLTTLISAEL